MTFTFFSIQSPLIPYLLDSILSQDDKKKDRLFMNIDIDKKIILLEGLSNDCLRKCKRHIIKVRAQSMSIGLLLFIKTLLGYLK